MRITGQYEDIYYDTEHLEVMCVDQNGDHYPKSLSGLVGEQAASEIWDLVEGLIAQRVAALLAPTCTPR